MAACAATNISSIYGTVAAPATTSIEEAKTQFDIADTDANRQLNYTEFRDGRLRGVLPGPEIVGPDINPVIPDNIPIQTSGSCNYQLVKKDKLVKVTCTKPRWRNETYVTEVEQPHSYSVQVPYKVFHLKKTKVPYDYTQKVTKYREEERTKIDMIPRTRTRTRTKTCVVPKVVYVKVPHEQTYTETYNEEQQRNYTVKIPYYEDKVVKGWRDEERVVPEVKYRTEWTTKTRSVQVPYKKRVCDQVPTVDHVKVPFYEVKALGNCADCEKSSGGNGGYPQYPGSNGGGYPPQNPVYDVNGDGVIDKYEANGTAVRGHAMVN